ncbi:putative glycosyltransferase EpsH [mine drainage metagenome]|uniref:Putative glycosyltransferase EpsH n=1 Tax=mine drainage metagenome TaxID=410659 RepID=A0A1J5STI7_9ZZZZ
MSAPQVTLLVPCHNAARFLPRLAECVRAQRLPFSEVVAYDDGSTDTTAEVARALGMRVIDGGGNRGVAVARNRLAAAAATEWMHFHDADDLMEPDFNSTLAALCSDEVDVVSCDADWVEEDSRALVLRWTYDADALRSQACAHLLRHPLSLNNSVIRRSLWSAVGGCDESLRMWEDSDVHVRMAHAGARWRHESRVLTIALRRTESFSHDYRASWNCRLATLEAYSLWSDAVSYRDDLAFEAERAARNLLFWGDRRSASRALALCRSHGGRPPLGASPTVRLLARFLPALWVISLQEARRRRVQNRQAGARTTDRPT